MRGFFQLLNPPLNFLSEYKMGENPQVLCEQRVEYSRNACLLFTVFKVANRIFIEKFTQ